MLDATGVCNGIENYSRYLTGRAPGEPPPTLFEFIPDNAIVFADESHVTVPQIGGMYRGDYRRKFTLAEHGFRLPSCMDNRPLKFEEWDAMRPQSVFVSATPAAWEMEQAAQVDGASSWQAFRKVIVPLAAPGVFTTAIITFFTAWNDFVFAISLTSDRARTVPAALAFFTGASQFEQPTGAIMAAAVVVTIPVVILVLFFQRRIVAGLTSGAVKG